MRNLKIHRYRDFVIKVGNPINEMHYMKIGGTLFPNSNPKRVWPFYKNLAGFGYTMDELVNDTVEAGKDLIDQYYNKKAPII